MIKEDMKWLLGICIGLFIGAAGVFTTLNVTDAEMKKDVSNNTLRVCQIESQSKQHQSDINILRVELSKTQTEVKNTDQSYVSLKKVLKELSVSMNNISNALVRLEERQKNSDKVIESLTDKIEKIYGEK